MTEIESSDLTDATQTSAPPTAPKPSVPSSASKSPFTPPIQKKDTGKATNASSGVASGVTGAAKSAASKAASVGSAKPYVGGAFEVPKIIDSRPKPSTPEVGGAPTEAERRSKRVTRKTRRPRE